MSVSPAHRSSDTPHYGRQRLVTKSLRMARSLQISHSPFTPRQGRHFADEVANGLARGLSLKAAIVATVELWSSWKISRRTSRETGIPIGLPYLTGFVTHCEIMSEDE